MASPTSSPDGKQPAATGPLVSVICRSMGRPELRQALESLASQTYQNLEILLVDAANRGISPAELPVAPKELRIVCTGRALDRPAAANAGLDEARGSYLLFLDEDDWIAPSHIEKLVGALERDQNKLAAYSGTRKTSPSGEALSQVFNRHWDRAFLRRDNFLPIHSVLFDASLLEKGCRFDETLHIYEDWDFWLQVSQFTDFIHLDEISAFYREGGDSETAVKEESHKFDPGHANALAREKIFAKWSSRWSGADINQMLGSMEENRKELARELDRAISDKKQILSSAENEKKALHKELDRAISDKQLLHGELQKSQKTVNEKNREIEKWLARVEARDRDLQSARQEIRALQQQYETLLIQHQELDRGVREILDSFSWRVTAPYRFLRRRFTDTLILPVRKLIVRFILRNPEVHEKVLARKSRQSDAPAALSEEHIACHLDSPGAANRLFSDTMVIQGWALARSGPVNLTVYIDDLEYRSITPGTSRPDVARMHPQIGHAATCGFYEKLPLQYVATGEHQLRLVITSPAGARSEAREHFHLYKGEELYNAWLRCKTGDYRRQREAVLALLARHSLPPVHVLCLLGSDTDNRRTLGSIAAQSITDFQVHLLGADSTEWREWLAGASDSRLQITASPSLADLDSEAWTDEHWVLRIEAGEQLAEYALQEFMRAAVESDYDLVYSDHDRIGHGQADGEDSDAPVLREQPVFTWQWSPEQLISHNYVGEIFLLRWRHWRSSIMNEAAGTRYAVLLDLSLNDELSAGRIPAVLWSAPAADQEVLQDQRRRGDAEVARFVERHQLAATLDCEEQSRSLRRALDDSPLVSIIIPTMGKLALVKPCIGSLLHKTAYQNFEVIILDNSRGQNPEGIEWLKNEGLTVLECNEPFNWARLNNKGAAVAGGDYLLFLNDDIEIIQSDWLEELLAQAQRPEVGAVGCKLLYPNGALQHAGVFLVNYGGGGLHLFHQMPPGPDIYLRLDLHVREVSANTGACLMVSRSKYEALDGFDEELAVVGNDVDLCLRLMDRGYRNIWTARCTLIHHESISREANVPREDEQALWKRWGKLFESGDPYYNPNLTLTKWDCSQEFDVPRESLLEQADVISDATENSVDTRLLPGVNLIGYIRADMGLGEAVRSDARAFDAGGINFGIINFETGNPGRMGNLAWRHKEILNAPFDINLVHINGDFLEMAINELPSHFFRGRYNIAYWAWELEKLPEHWLPSLSLVDEIWVPSEFVRAAVQRETDKPVVVIPHNVDLPGNSTYGRGHFGIPEQAFVFLAMYDTRSIAERKNPQAAVRAFRKAFSGDNRNVCLALKLNNANAEDLDTLRQEIASHPNILILDSTHSRAEIDGLLGCIDCYVSLHRSEGFGLGPAEAMNLGVPCILTNWSGNTDYMTPDNCLPVDYKLVKLKQDYGPYNKGQRWAEADIRQASRHMEALVADPELARRLGAAARATIRDHFSPAAVGKLAAARLAEIRAAREQASEAEPTQTAEHQALQ